MRESFVDLVLNRKGVERFCFDGGLIEKGEGELDAGWPSRGIKSGVEGEGDRRVLSLPTSASASASPSPDNVFMPSGSRASTAGFSWLIGSQPQEKTANIFLFFALLNVFYFSLRLLNLSWISLESLEPLDSLCSLEPLLDFFWISSNSFMRLWIL